MLHLRYELHEMRQFCSEKIELTATWLWWSNAWHPNIWGWHCVNIACNMFIPQYLRVYIYQFIDIYVIDSRVLAESIFGRESFRSQETRQTSTVKEERTIESRELPVSSSFSKHKSQPSHSTQRASIDNVQSLLWTTELRYYARLLHERTPQSATGRCIATLHAAHSTIVDCCCTSRARIHCTRSGLRKKRGRRGRKNNQCECDCGARCCQ